MTTPETPPVISAVVHATDEEKLAVTNQKWTCMTVDLEADKQDYPQPSDLSTFVNETKFNSPTEGKQLGGRWTATLPRRPLPLGSKRPGKELLSQVTVLLGTISRCTPSSGCLLKQPEA